MPAVAPKLTAVTVLVSPASGSVSLVSTLPLAGEPPEPLAMPPFSVASPVSATAVGEVFGVVVTAILKVSLAARPPRSVAVTLTPSVPTFAAVGVPLNVRVAALKRQPCGERRAVGGGRRVGESVAAIDVGEGAGGQRQREGRADGRVLVAGLDRKHRRVVGAVNGDRERRRGRGAGRIAHGVAEDIGQRIGRLPQAPARRNRSR